MTHGGARKGAGRKPTPLADKLAAGNPGHRPLKKIAWGGEKKLEPPEYLKAMKSADTRTEALPTPAEIFTKTVKQLEPSGCLELIGEELLAEYALAKYYLLIAQFDLSKTAIVGHSVNGEIVVTGFTDAVLKLQKNVSMVWGQIWDIVARNSETAVKNPENDIYAQMIGGRTHLKPKKGADGIGLIKYPEDTGDEA